MNFELAHTLSKEEAKRRIAALFERWNGKYGISARWNGDSAKVDGNVKGITIDATLEVCDKVLKASGKDPGFLVRAAATGYLKSKLTACLDPTRTEEESGLA